MDRMRLLQARMQYKQATQENLQTPIESSENLQKRREKLHLGATLGLLGSGIGIVLGLAGALSYFTENHDPNVLAATIGCGLVSFAVGTISWLVITSPAEETPPPLQS